MSMMIAECGFYAVNGKHCVINGHCVVCKATDTPQLKKGETIQLKDFGGLDGTYTIADIRDNRLKLELLRS